MHSLDRLGGPRVEGLEAGPPLCGRKNRRVDDDRAVFVEHIDDLGLEEDFELATDYIGEESFCYHIFTPGKWQ